MRLTPLLVVSLLICLVSYPTTPTHAAVVQKTLTKTITYEYSYNDYDISLYAALSLGYEFNITYEDTVIVNNPTSINISASDVDVDFVLDLSFEWDIPLLGTVSGSLHLDWDSTMSLGYYMKNPFTLYGTLTITVDTWLGSDTYSVSFTVTGYIRTLLNIISGIVSVDGTAIPQDQWVYENVTWTFNNNTYTVNLQPNSAGIIHLDVIDPTIFIVPTGLFIEDLTLYDLPVVGDVTIPINYGYGIYSSKANSGKDNFHVMQDTESYSLGSFSANIEVVTPFEASYMMWIIILGIIAVAVVIVAIVVMKKRKEKTWIHVH